MKNKIIIILSVVWLITGSVYAQELDLDSCKVLSLKNNRQVEQAQYKLDGAIQLKRFAFTKYFPKIEANAFAVRANDYMLKQEIPAMNLPVYDGNPINLLNPTQFAYFPGMEIATLDYSNMGSIAAIQPVFMGGRIYFSNRLAKLNVEVKQDALALSEEEVLAKTESMYWKLVTLKEKRKVLNGYQHFLENLEKDASVSARAGLAQQSDVLKVQLKLNEIETKRLELENGITLLKMAFCQHLGIPYTTSFNVIDTLFAEEPPELVYTNHNEALKQRKEYAMLSKAVEAEHLKKKVDFGEHLPQVAVGVQGLYLDQLNQENTYGLAFATISVPISDWWGATYKAKEHRILEDIARSELEEKSELMVLQMEQAYKDLVLSYQKINVANSSVEQALAHYKIVNDNYNAGILNTSTLLEAQALLQDAKNNLLESKSEYRLKLINYKKSIGK